MARVELFKVWYRKISAKDLGRWRRIVNYVCKVYNFEKKDSCEYVVYDSERLIFQHYTESELLNLSKTQAIVGVLDTKIVPVPYETVFAHQYSQLAGEDKVFLLDIVLEEHNSAIINQYAVLCTTQTMKPMIISWNRFVYLLNTTNFEVEQIIKKDGKLYLGIDFFKQALANDCFVPLKAPEGSGKKFRSMYEWLYEDMYTAFPLTDTEVDVDHAVQYSDGCLMAQEVVSEYAGLDKIYDDTDLLTDTIEEILGITFNNVEVQYKDLQEYNDEMDGENYVDGAEALLVYFNQSESDMVGLTYRSFVDFRINAEQAEAEELGLEKIEPIQGNLGTFYEPITGMVDIFESITSSDYIHKKLSALVSFYTEEDK